MKDITIRLYYRDDNGMLHDDQEDYGLETFAGVVPVIGDKLLRPGVPSGLDRRRVENREIIEVVDRYFNPRDLTDYIVLVVTSRTAQRNEFDLIG